MTYNLPHAGAGASPHDDAGARRRPRRQRAPDAAAEAGPNLALNHAGLGLGHHIFLFGSGHCSNNGCTHRLFVSIYCLLISPVAGIITYC